MLKNAELYKEGNRYYLHVTYQFENDKEIYELDIPKIVLPFAEDCVMMECSVDHPYTPTVELGFGELVMDAVPDEENPFGKYFTRKIIETKERTMTVAEIEKALGYKVKIISKEEK